MSINGVFEEKTSQNFPEIPSTTPDDDIPINWCKQDKFPMWTTPSNPRNRPVVFTKISNKCLLSVKQIKDLYCVILWEGYKKTETGVYLGIKHASAVAGL